MINKFSDKMALIMAEGYKKRGLIDACEGSLHYCLRYKALKIDQNIKKGNKIMPALGFKKDNTIDSITICPVCYEKLIKSSEFGELIAVTTPPQIVKSDNLCPECGLSYGRKAAKQAVKKIISKIEGKK